MGGPDQHSNEVFDAVGAGPAVVLLHAGIADRRMWREHLGWIADSGHRVVALDLPGFGEHVPSPQSLPPWEATVAVMDDLGIGAAVVVGCSFGGAVALRLAVTAPDRVRALALISAPAPDMEPSARLHAVWTAETEAMERGDIDAAIDVVLAGWLAPDAPGELRDLVASMQRRAFELEAHGAPEEPPDPVEHPQRLRDIAVPALVAAGEYDMPDFLSSAHTLAETLPGSSHQVIAGAGHLAPLERPAAFRSLLEQFLTSVDRR
ncbi:MAG: alpha/beta fold hydrolase [Solirubrobacteraceae bacterium]